MQRPLFILAGNGSYLNRGCEAIVRGTTRIIRDHFDHPEFRSVGFFLEKGGLNRQKVVEKDTDITHFEVHPFLRRFESGWVMDRILSRLSSRVRIKYIYREILADIKRSCAVLSLGGDNYTLDYGIPDFFLATDDLALDYRKPMIIWGASIGPFSSMPEYERKVIQHLRKVTGLFIRESATIDYLYSKGVKDNVFRVADPAFLLEPCTPLLEQPIVDGSIGVNLSPLMANYATSGDRAKWVALAADIVRRVHIVTRRKVYLIPHETNSHTNDYVFLRDVLSLLQNEDVELIPDKYDAAETKWIISKMIAFAGARMHSTIAAISSGVPTLSFVYSVKGKGINKDLFGDARYCISPENLTPDNVAMRMEEIITERVQIKAGLEEKLFLIKKLSLRAGAYLRELVFKKGNEKI